MLCNFKWDSFAFCRTVVPHILRQVEKVNRINRMRDATLLLAGGPMRFRSPWRAVRTRIQTVTDNATLPYFTVSEIRYSTFTYEMRSGPDRFH